jgi:hypothetical protein
MDDQTPAAQVSPEAFLAAMRQETERMLRQVMEAVNKARDGAWINDSEGQVRDLLGEYRRRVFEVALQLKANVAEGAFSPGGPGDRQAAELQGAGGTQHPDQQRPRQCQPAALGGAGGRRADADRRPAR